MEETFEQRPLLDAGTLRALQARADLPSALRLALHLGSFAALIALVLRVHAAPIAALAASVLLAWVWSALFAPFHECTHRTAFRGRRANALGAWLTAVPFMMAPAVYRVFHFEHHRHTQDPARDPELLDDPRYAAWPPGPRGWLLLASGWGLLMLKVRPLLGFACQRRAHWPAFAPWEHRISDPAEVVRQSRVILAAWLAFVLAALLVVPGGAWLLFAAWLAQAFQALWVSAEHTGLPLEGSILARTRTVDSNAFVRFWLWNMNYHAEHHAWPGIPWHRLGDAHRAVAPALESHVSGYTALHHNVFTGRARPSADPAHDITPTPSPAGD